MRVFDTEIPDVKIIEPTVYEDERGYFFEAYNAQKFEDLMGFCPNFYQSNESGSVEGTIRGLHLQKEPYGQSKLVRVISGEVLDVVVDCRKGSKTFGRYIKVHLDSKNKLQLWIPRGCAHGFQVISDYCILSYHVDAPYNPGLQVSIDAFDKALGIDWHKTPEFCMSAQDELAMSFSDAIDVIE
ncbi:dTDP-4-dehydrorhamnose 3,5-epimerase [Candidatus Ponderosibacter sp. Uisw_141_02]|jgi:dTDP-4-dehydrorhamnose 3,5-epimerase|uniref:dTDP-4-dehydrorhamnose 3,5-epimerase n=1 Tax=Candidatus Ponderosibacter sp. Uisw_141_02 TaxID=3231000 RepID=UPI003D515305